MSSGVFNVPAPINETIRDYNSGSTDRAHLQATYDDMSRHEIEVPLVIGDKTIETGDLGDMRMPHRHGHLLGRYHRAGADEVKLALETAESAWREWSDTSWEDRAAIFLRAADILAGPYRAVMNAATMLCQSKTAYQAEIDSACEFIDFLRYNVYFMRQLYGIQPFSPAGVWNRMEYRPLEGFVFAVTPFNFTAIAANLPMAAALMGNVVIWKPASSAVYTAHHIMKLWEMAGLPRGVITMLPGPSSEIGALLDHPNLAGVHFTGSTPTFQDMWHRVGHNIEHYHQYPRLVGETGGKDFVVAHVSSDAAELATALVRGAFEYQGQKCSAASRAYIPDTLWPQVKDKMEEQIADIRVGDVRDFRNFMGAVIDQDAFARISGYLDYAGSTKAVRFVHQGVRDNSEGYFVGPNVVETTDADDRLMREEIFGPVLTVHVYDEKRFDDILDRTDKTSPYALTGSIFARDRRVVDQASRVLRYAAGNFYINDKPTGAVVGQQPFGGGRASGTNDKAGSIFNLMKWVTPRTIKETFVPPRDFHYPFMKE